MASTTFTAPIPNNVLRATGDDFIGVSGRTFGIAAAGFTTGAGAGSSGISGTSHPAVTDGFGAGFGAGAAGVDTAAAASSSGTSGTSHPAVTDTGLGAGFAAAACASAATGLGFATGAGAGADTAADTAATSSGTSGTSHPAVTDTAFCTLAGFAAASTGAGGASSGTSTASHPIVTLTGASFAPSFGQLAVESEKVA